MKKIKLPTEGLTGENLKFVEALNQRFADVDVVTSEDVAVQVRSVMKGLLDESGTPVVDFAKMSKLDFDKLAALTAEGEGNVRSVLEKQGLMIKALQELGDTSNTTSHVRSVRDQLKEYMDANKDKLAAFKSGDSKAFGTRSEKDGETGAGIELQTRAAVTMTVAASSGGSKYSPEPEIQSGLVDLTRNRPFLESYANTSTTTRARIVWTEKFNKQGQAAWLLEGQVKPLISFEWRSFESYAKKVADKIKVSTEALDDVDWLAAEIEAELKYEVDIAVDVALLTGVGDGTSGAASLQGITARVGGYVLTTIKTTTPNNFDALRAAYAQIVTLNQNPTHVFINPIDGANMDLAKDANGRPLMMDYRGADGRLFRLTPIETNQIPVGSFLMGDMSRFKIRNYKPFAVYYGWVNDDFERNLVTIIGERRLHAFLATNDLGAFIYEQFADVKTLLLAA